MGPLFGSSGIRRVADRQFLSLAFDAGVAVGALYRSVVVGQDTRTSSGAVGHALISGLLSAGCRAYDAGVVPTPTLAYASRRFDAGAMVTASHNPPHYNGLKLWNRDGSAFDTAQRQEVEEGIALPPPVPWEHMESSRPYPGALEAHLDRILRDFGRAPFKVVVDGGGGAASLATPQLLKELGGEVMTLNCQPTGIFPRGSEPLPENLTELMALVTSTGAHLGIAHDGDGDRTVAVDDKGRFVPGDKLLILLARGLGVSRLVTTVDATMALEETGLEVVRTKVGDAHVSETLKKKGGDLGGEPAGAWIFPRISYCPDGLYAAAQLAFMASAERLSALVDSIPSYPLLRGSVDGEPAWGPLEERLMDLKPLSTNGEDGLKLLFADGWLLVRPSGTEPKIRVSAEARDAKEAERLFRRGMEIVRASVKEEQGALR